MLNLCLYGPCTNFNLATATWETTGFAGVAELQRTDSRKISHYQRVVLKTETRHRKTGIAMPSIL